MVPKRIQLMSLLMMTVMAAAGCSKKEDAVVPAEETAAPPVRQPLAEVVQQPPAEPAAQQAQVTYDTVLKLWQDGQKEQAAKVFLTIDWQARGVFSEDSVFSLSESAFKELTPARQEQIRAQAKEAVDQIKDMLQYFTFQAKQSDLKRQEYHRSVSAFGKRLSEEHRLDAIRLVGPSIVRYAQEEF